MSRGRRYSGEGKLNIKKVVAVLIALALIVIVIISIAKLLGGNKVESKVVATEYFAVYTDGKWGVINQEGEIITKPIYELDWYYPTFIGKYYRLNIWTSESQYSDEIE